MDELDKLRARNAVLQDEVGELTNFVTNGQAQLQQLRAQVAQLREALEEIAEWWANWIPDDAVEQGGYDALRKARAALEATK